MKNTIALIAAIVALGSTTFARNIDVGDLPNRVSNTIERYLGEDRLDEVTVRQIPGNNRYVVSLALQGNTKLRLFISANGKLIRVSRGLNLNNLPQKVRTVVEEFLDENDDVISLERVRRGSQVSYVIRIQTDDDEETRIVLSQDGTLIQSEEDLDIQELPFKLRKAVRVILREGVDLVDLDRVVNADVVSYRLVIRLFNGTDKTFILDARGRIVEEEDDSSAT